MEKLHTCKYGLAAERTRRWARNRGPPGQQRATSANLCDNIASLRKSPTSGALPETRIASPIIIIKWTHNKNKTHF